jgi:hypothetical protein
MMRAGGEVGGGTTQNALPRSAAASAARAGIIAHRAWPSRAASQRA